jgi:hypothetical protein
MGFKEFYHQSTEVEESLQKGLQKFVGKTLTAKQNIVLIERDLISSEGEFLSDKDVVKEFLWMKKGFKTELVESSDKFFVSSKDGNFDFSEEVLDRLLNGRLIAIK